LSSPEAIGEPVMRTVRKHSPGVNFSKRELKQLLLLLLLMILAVLYGAYIGWWSLRKEEEENAPQRSSGFGSEFRRNAAINKPFVSQSHPIECNG